MTKTAAPVIEPEQEPGLYPPETQPRRSGGWLRNILRRIRLGMGGDDDALLVMNRTPIAWYIYHDYHLLGILDAHERRTYHPARHGTLNVRPTNQEQQVEYLVLPLTAQLRRVQIYYRRMSTGVEFYDLRAI